MHTRKQTHTRAVFDLANMWLERQAQPPTPEACEALGGLVWARGLPLAADFLACMAANVPFAGACRGGS